MSRAISVPYRTSIVLWLASFLLALGVAVWLVFLASCSKAPTSLAQEATSATPAQPAVMDQPAGKAAPALPQEKEQQEAQALPSATAVPQWRNPQAQAAVEAYRGAYETLQGDREAAKSLEGVDPLSNPGAFTDYANQLGTHANQLDQAERAAKHLLDLKERKRFKTYQDSLRTPPDEEE